MRRTKEQWRRDVFKSTDKRMTPAAKVLCLYLADHMDAERHVSLPRDVIATALGVHPQRVAERFAKAVSAGFLYLERGGYVGRTSEYQGTWPGEHVPRQTGRKRTALQDALGPMRTAPQDAFAERYALSDPDPRNDGAMRTAERYTKESPHPTGLPRTPETSTGEPHKRSNEEPVDAWPDVDPYLDEVVE